MDLEPLDERIVIRVPGDLRNKLQKIAEDEDTSITGAARALIRDGIDSRQKIEEMERQYDQLLEAFISTNRANRITCLTLVKTCINILEKTVGEEQGKTLIDSLQRYAELLTESDVFDKNFDRGRRESMVEQFEKLIKAEAVEE
jgi:hypothetical protein